MIAALDATVTSDRDSSNALKPIFDKKKIEAGFAIAGTLAREANTFVNNRVQEHQQALREVEAQLAQPSEQRDYQKLAKAQRTLKETQTWEMGGNGRLLLTALTAAVGGNVTGSAGALLQAAAVNTLQGLAAQQVKLIADSLESETARTALQAVVAGAGAAMRGENITSAALGASASVVLHNLVKVAYEQDEQDSLSLEQREACKNLVTTLIAGTTAALGGDAAVATTAATIETENNAAFIPVVFGIIYLADKAYTTYQIYQDVTAYRNGEKSLEQIALERGEEYLTGILVGNLAKYGYKVAKVGGKWVARVFKEGVKHRDEFATATASGAGSSAAYFSKGTGKAAKNPTLPKAKDAAAPSNKQPSNGSGQPRGPADASQRGGKNPGSATVPPTNSKGTATANATKDAVDNPTMPKVNAFSSGSTKKQSLATVTGNNAVDAGQSVINSVSNTAFNATKNISNWTPKSKHMVGTTASRAAQFGTDDISKIRDLLKEALNSPQAKFIPNNVDGAFRVVVDMGRPIGTKGQTSIRIIVGSDGKIWNAFPVTLR